MKQIISLSGTLSPAKKQDANKRILTYKQSKKIAALCHIRTKAQWEAFVTCNNIINLPSAPDETYAGKGWQGWRPFFADNLLPYKEAQKLARSLNIKTSREWALLIQDGTLPPSVPVSPASYYKGAGWTSWGSFLNTEGTLPYQEARKVAQALGIYTANSWLLMCKSGDRPSTLPSAPATYYKGKGWVSWEDFLGKNPFLPFFTARALVKKLGLTSKKEYINNLQALPAGLPRFPEKAYRYEWVSWDDYLGTTTRFVKKEEKLPFKKARNIARKMGVKSNQQWRTMVNRGELPDGMPSRPDLSYKDEGWSGWRDFLRTKNFASYNKARQEVKKLNLRSSSDWWVKVDNSNRPDTLPANPPRYYKDDGWKGWKHFLSL